MTKYHLGDEGQPLPCKADYKCPKGDNDPHFNGTLKEARKWAEELNAENMGGAFAKKNSNVSAGAITNKKDLISHVTKADLNYSGEKPRWLEENDNTELLDVIEYDGRQIAVVNEVDSTKKVDKHPTQKGFKVSNIDLKDFDTEETIGYVKSTKITDESFKKAFGDDDYAVFRYRDKYPTAGTAGYSNGLRTFDNATTDEERIAAKKKLLVAANNSVNGWDDWIRESDAPEDEDEIDMELSLFSETDEQAHSDIRELKKTFAEPYVDYINVEDEHQDKALGSALYLYAAKRLAKDGERLRASGVQSDSAKKSWGRMKEKFPDNVSFEQNPNSKEEEYAFLDFRES